MHLCVLNSVLLMLTLSRVSAKPQIAGEPLPTIFPAFERAGIRPRFGQVTMIAGQPNAGKSNLGLYMAIQYVRAGLWGWYCSADTDEGETLFRASACLSGDSKEHVEEGMRSSGRYYYEEFLEEITDLRFTFDPNPSPEDIRLEMAAFEEVYGAHPDFIVIDNLLNISAESEDDWVGLRDLTKLMHFIARKYGCAVFVLHHCSEAQGNPEWPPPRKAIQGKVSQFPELCLTVAARKPDQFLACAVKNRSGPADPEAKTPIELYVDLSRLRFAETKLGLIT